MRKIQCKDVILWDERQNMILSLSFIFSGKWPLYYVIKIENIA